MGYLSHALLAQGAADPTQGLQKLFWSHETCSRRYKGWELLGRGGFGTVVIKTLCIPYGHDIALKIIPQYDDEQLVRFQREIFNVRQLHSANIVKTFGADALGTFFLIEMENVFGPTLEKDLRDREKRGEPYTLAEAIDIAIDVANALIEAHSHALIHRDIKPSNILLPPSRRPIAKLADFGVSRFLDAGRLTQTGCSPGTPKFWAPEVCAGKPHTPASDVYSFIACLYLMLSGNRYFYEIHADPSPTTYAEAAKNQTPIPITVFNKAFPEELIALITKGLDKDPGTRPAAARVRDILTNLKERVERSSAAPASPPSGETTPATTPRYALVGAGLVLALALAAGLAVRHKNSGAPQEATPATGPAQSVVPTSGGTAAGRVNESPVRVDIDRLSAIITNTSEKTTPTLRLVLVTPDGAEHTGELPSLAPNEDLAVALDGFKPPVPAGLHTASLALRPGADSTPTLFVHLEAERH